MRIRFLLSLIASFVVLLGIAQPRLTYKKNALKSGDLHVVHKAEVIDCGTAGANQVWDFSGMKCGETEKNDIVYSDECENYSQLIGNNTAIKSEQTTFFFNITPQENNFVGMTTANGIISYKTPITRMKYPFGYGDNFTGSFEGDGLYHGTILSNIAGSYETEADGYGILILPNNIFENVLRVKSITHTLEVTFCHYTQTKVTKYMWYSQDYRYPILTILETESERSGEETKLTKYAYYNEKAFTAKQSLNATKVNEYLNYDLAWQVYPNPFKENLTVKYELTYDEKVSIELFNNNGQRIDIIKPLANEKVGNYQTTYNKEIKPGTYFVRFLFGEKSYVEKVVKEN